MTLSPAERKRCTSRAECLRQLAGKGIPTTLTRRASEEIRAIPRQALVGSCTWERKSQREGTRTCQDSGRTVNLGCLGRVFGGRPREVSRSDGFRHAEKTHPAPPCPPRQSRLGPGRMDGRPGDTSPPAGRRPQGQGRTGPGDREEYRKRALAGDGEHRYSIQVFTAGVSRPAAARGAPRPAR